MAGVGWVVVKTMARELAGAAAAPARPRLAPTSQIEGIRHSAGEGHSVRSTSRPSVARRTQTRAREYSRVRKFSGCLRRALPVGTVGQDARRFVGRVSPRSPVCRSPASPRAR
eukprot:10551411-Lingulodinium_polyedra.AAC.1